MRNRKIAIRFSSQDDYNRGVHELFTKQYSFEWVLAGVFKIDAQDAEELRNAGIHFEEVKIIPISELPPEEQKKIRREYWGEGYPI